MAIKKIKIKKPEKPLASKTSKSSNLVVMQEKSSDIAKRAPEIKSFVENLRDKNSHVDNTEMMDVLLEKGYVSEEEIAGIFSQEFGIEYIKNIKEYEITKEVLGIIPRKICERHILIPISKIGKTLVVAFSDPSNMHTVDNISMITDLKVQPTVATRSDIKELLDKYYDSKKEFDNLFYNFSSVSESADEDLVDLDTNKNVSKDDDTVISFVNLIFSDAIRLKSSDIHVEVYEKSFRIRYRIDGILHEKHNLQKEMAAAVISRIKVISNMDISEKRKPQDARLKLRFQGKELNMRVNSTPTVNGEKIVLRVLDDSALKVDMESLGMEDFQIKLFKENLSRPQGLILMTGPTGSGKTTTIYSGLMKLNTPDCNISTAEDPVEFRIHGINQVQMNPKIGLNFSETLRAFLRQDPDVILVGEIRDLETAEIAYKASSTGHLVLSSLHTNDTSSTVTRLLSMGVPFYNVAESTSIIISQRLLRKVCESCRKKMTNVPDTVLEEIEVPKDQYDEYKDNLYEKGSGCRNCSDLGYKGRVAVYEMMRVTSSIKKGIFEKASPQVLKKIAVEKDNMKTLRQAGLLKLKKGLTTVEEILRGTMADNI